MMMVLRLWTKMKIYHRFANYIEHQHQQKDYPLSFYFFSAVARFIKTDHTEYVFSLQRRARGRQREWKNAVIIFFCFFACVAFPHVLIKKVVCTKMRLCFLSNAHSEQCNESINHIQHKSPNLFTWIDFHFTFPKFSLLIGLNDYLNICVSFMNWLTFLSLFTVCIVYSAGLHK